MKPQKPVKVTINGRQQTPIDLHRTTWGRFKYRVLVFLKKVFLISVVIVMFYFTYVLGGMFNPSVIYTKAEVIKEVEAKAPVMARIAKCESPTGHWKNGQVATNGNDNGSVDMGKYMINTRIWGAKATTMGLNLAVEKDNEEFAQYLYKQFGTEPWKWSKPCWNK